MVRAQEVVEASGTVVRRKPLPGDYRWDGSVWHRWTGRRWARAAYSLDPGRLRVPTRLDEDPGLGRERLDRALARAVEDQVAVNGATVVHQGPSGVVLGYRRREAHLLHGVMTVLTAGLWGVVWIAIVLSRREDRVRLEIDPWGNVWARVVTSA
jgi:hypothetical protein